MDPDIVATIEVVAPPIENEEPLMAEKVKTQKLVDLKVELQWRALSKNGNKAMLCNILL